MTKVKKNILRHLRIAVPFGTLLFVPAALSVFLNPVEMEVTKTEKVVPTCPGKPTLYRGVVYNLMPEEREGLEKGAQKHGVETHYKPGIDGLRLRMLTFARKESWNDSLAVSPTGAQGLYQLSRQTRKDYNVLNACDPYESGDKAAQLITDNFRHLTNYLNRAPTIGEEYLAYNIGPRAAAYIIKHPYKRTPDWVWHLLKANNGKPTQPGRIYAHMIDRELGKHLAIVLAEQGGTPEAIDTQLAGARIRLSIVPMPSPAGKADMRVAKIEQAPKKAPAKAPAKDIKTAAVKTAKTRLAGKKSREDVMVASGDKNGAPVPLSDLPSRNSKGQQVVSR